MRKDKLISEILGEENAITPSDLYSTEFKNALVGGYDKAEVDAFLERVGDAFEALINQSRALKEELESQRHKVEELRDMESTLRNALVSAQKFSQDARDAARREADALLGEARLEKQRVRLSYGELPAGLREEIHALRAARDRIRADIRAMLATHSALLYEIPTAEDQQDVSLPPFAAVESYSPSSDDDSEYSDDDESTVDGDSDERATAWDSEERWNDESDEAEEDAVAGGSTDWRRPAFDEDSEDDDDGDEDSKMAWTTARDGREEQEEDEADDEVENEDDEDDTYRS